MHSRNSLPVALFALALLFSPRFARAENEIGYLEKFALAADREKALGELVPGTEDFYYYHALHFQHTRNEARLAEILAQWRKRFPDASARRTVIENREALLDYDTAPQATLEYLKDRLGVEFTHEQEVRDQPPNLPTALDPALIARSVFEADALMHDPELESLSAGAAEALVAQKTPLSLEQRRTVLEMLERPDVPGLVEFILDELRSEDAGGFGSFSIHRDLLPAQLDALVKALPAIATEEDFVHTRLSKLAPSPEVDLLTDTAEREAWLTRLWAYAQKLPPAFNTIKAGILYLRLDHDRKNGVYDPARFLEYLKIPRNLDYVHPRWLETHSQHAVDADADLPDVISELGFSRHDESLVREYFLALFQRAAAANPRTLGEAMMKPYVPYVRDTWLKPILAEAVIVGGHGAPERWASLLSPAAFQQLKDRVDIEFPKTNPELFAPGADVAFDVTLKNTPKLIVKIYELNALNIFRDQGRQLNTDLALDGLVANSEQTHTFDAGPFKRVRQTFQFPELKNRRGAWLIEFIGGGRSSRALVRVGQWQIVQHGGPSGDIIHVLDEAAEPVPDAVAWLDGRKYVRDEKLGGIVIPFTAEPKRRPIVVGTADGSFATLTEFYHHAEHYLLDADFHLEREQLLAGRRATLAIRAGLRMGGAQLDPSILRDVRLTVTAKTRGDIFTTQEFDNVKLTVGGVLTQEIAVPENLAAIEARLSAKVEKLSAGGEKVEITSSDEWELNQIDETADTYDGHLAKFGNDYVYELLGKNGEPLAERPIVFAFTRRGFERPQTVSLKTDARGRVMLGPLAGIAQVAAEAPNEREGTWTLRDFARTWDESVHVGAGQPVRIPAPPELPAAPDVLRKEISLLQENRVTYVADLAANVKWDAGFLVIEGLAPGDYSLRFRSLEREIAIKVSAGKPSHGWFLGKARNLEAHGEAPLHISAITTNADTITVQLANVTPFTRVHVAATRFDPGAGIFRSLSGFMRDEPSAGSPPRWPNLFSADRAIGDEHRYILERRHTQSFPGNMLPRPGLLLNPWEIRGTDLEIATVRSGEAAPATEGGTDGGMEDGLMSKMMVPMEEADFEDEPTESNLDFLASPAPVLYNLIPGEDGTVKIDRRALGDRQHVQVYADDLANAVWQTVALPEAATKLADRRLARNLDPAKPFAQKKEVSLLAAGQSLTLEDAVMSEVETYDAIGGIYALFRTLNGDPKFAEFAWLLEWPHMDEAARRAKVSEFACHELHVFLWRKDPAFFEQVIRPFLENKKDKTFLDDFLIGADLAKYLEPAEYARLNFAERALLGLRTKDAAANGARELRERWELVPPNPELEDRLFETALRSSELEGAGPGAEATAAGGGASALAPGVFALTGLTDPSFQVVIRGLDSKADRKFGAKGIPGMEPPAAPATPQGGSEGKEPIPSDAASPAGEKAGIEGLKADSKTPATSTEWSYEGDRKLLESQFPFRPSVRPSELRGLPITAGNRSGNLAISANAIDALLFGQAETTVARAEYRALYRHAGPTKEWAENNYYKLRIAEQNEALIPINAFWRDYAAWVADGANGAFLSAHVAEAHRNFSEAMLALAVLDLPFEAAKHDRRTEGARFTLNARGPAMVFHKQIKPAVVQGAEPGAPRLLVAQSFFRHDDRHRMVGNEQIEKYVTAEFLTGVVYGANVVVTNPTSAPVKAEVLLQIPQGALPVLGSKATDAKRARLDPYSTQTFEYHFYFPTVPAEGGEFPHFPVNVSLAGKAAEAATVAAARPFTFRVVEKLTEVDKTSWNYISQHGSVEEVFAFLAQHNLASVDLDRLAWRCRDAAFFTRIVAFLRAHHTWNETIYSYALLHNDAAALREWLQHQDDFIAACGPWFASKLVAFDAIARRTYEHLEYAPLVNQRAHRLGREWRIANPAVREQYQRFLDVLAHKPALDSADQLGVVYYLFLQDRVEEALTRFRGVDAAALPTKLQYDYLRCYAHFYEGNLAEARGIAAGYSAHPVPRWRLLFADARAQLDEVEGKPPTIEAGDQPDREKQQSALAANEPAFDFKVEDKAIALTWSNLAEVTINYYRMDPEFAFSSNPFVKQDGSRFSVIKPSHAARHELPKDKSALAVPLPAELERANVLIEVLGAGARKTQTHFANTLRLTLTENYGRMEVRDAATSRALPQAYVKVYARLKDGTVRFFKDGYTDLRGRFDYASLNGSAGPQAPPPPTRPLPGSGSGAGAEPKQGQDPSHGLDYQMLKPTELDLVDKLAILVHSETHGATTREANPPRP